MPANDVKFGISRHAGTLIDSVETDDSVQVKELPGSNGEIARVKPYRKMTEGSVKGPGALAVVPGVKPLRHARAQNGSLPWALSALFPRPWPRRETRRSRPTDRSASLCR